MKDGTRLDGLVLDPPEAKGPVVRVEVLLQGNPVVREIARDEVRWIRRIRGDQAEQASNAQAALEKGQHRRAIALLQRLTRARPRDPVAHRELGFALLLANRDEEGLASLQQATQLDPTDFEAQLMLAQLFERQQRLDEAIQSYRQAAFIGLRHAVAWRSLARLLMQRAAPGDRDQALRALGLAARESPRDEGIALDRADILLESGDPADETRAREVLESLLKRAPTAPIVSSRLASLDAAQGKFAPARDRLQTLLKQVHQGDPRRDWLQAEWALYAWLAADPRPAAPPGTDVGQDGVDAEAAAYRLDMIIELQPEDGPLLLARARVDIKRDRPDVARVWLEAAALAGPSSVTSDALLLQSVATSLQRARLLPEAPPLRTFFSPDVSLRKAQRLVELLPWRVAAHETLARVFEREGDYEQAQRSYLAARERTADAAVRARLGAAAAHAHDEAQRRDRNRDM